MFLKDVLKKMQTLKNGKPVKFDIKVREFNRQTKRGGKLKSYKNVEMMIAGYTPVKKTREERLKTKAVTRDRKNPHHWDNRTRNIKLPTGEIKKINILLITEFNGEKVYY